MNDQNTANAPIGLRRHLSPLGVWALSFGCAVGWGSFVMPGTTFLPNAGPLGTAIGIGLGALVMLIIGMNYHFLIQKYPDAGGTMSYTIKSYGYDHGFLSAWFLVLVYVAIIWANATALALIARKLFGSTLQFGFHYQVSGFDVWGSEILMSVAALVAVSLLCMHCRRVSMWLQIMMAVVLIGGIIICFVGVMIGANGSPAFLEPAYVPDGSGPLHQILHIVMLAPWAYVGFESVSHSAEEFKFSSKKTIWLMVAAVVTSAVAYTLLSLLAASVLPEGFASWPEYLASLDSLEGLKGLPTFYATSTALGNAGLALLGVTVLCGILTGLLGNLVAASRLLYAMAGEGILPRWFGKLNRRQLPKNAILFLLLLSSVIPLLGRTAIGWIVDVTTIGATVAFGYTSAAALQLGRREQRRLPLALGIVGLVFSVVFFFYFMAIAAGAMSTESYLILAFWSILGFAYFRSIFRRDQTKRFGKSTVVWIGLLFLIFFTTLMWVRQSTNNSTSELTENLAEHYEELNPMSDPDTMRQTEEYLKEQMEESNNDALRNSLIQTGLTILGLAIMFSVYNTISRRERSSEIEKVKAEQKNKAKSTFLSNMSHDIRTPMNAIVGYTALAKKEPDIPPRVAEYLDKIEVSSHHLLSLINDVLEMSRIESGKMELEPVPTDLRQALREVEDMFATQMATKNIRYTVDTEGVQDTWVLCDRKRLDRILLNLISNAYKFTPENGSVRVGLRQLDGAQEGFGAYELRVKDSGIGMSKEFAAKVFESFSREKSSTVSKIQGTGLGMSITKSFVDLMGGTVDVETEQGKGTEFIVRLSLPLTEAPAEAQSVWDSAAAEEELDFSKMRLLLVDDVEMNREIAMLILEEFGFAVETAENGKEALERVQASKPGEFDAVLMDVRMPVMNGYDATRAIRKLDDPALARIPIIAMTGDAFSEDVQNAMDAGMDAHIAKPIDIGQLIDTLTIILKK